MMTIIARPTIKNDNPYTIDYDKPNLLTCDDTMGEMNRDHIKYRVVTDKSFGIHNNKLYSAMARKHHYTSYPFVEPNGKEDDPANWYGYDPDSIDKYNQDPNVIA